MQVHKMQYLHDDVMIFVWSFFPLPHSANTQGTEANVLPERNESYETLFQGYQTSDDNKETYY